MATYISRASGNFITASTWAQTSTTAESDSEAVSTTTTVAYQYSSTFIPAASAIDGIAIKIASRVAVATGSVSVYLNNNTAATLRSGSVTLNISDFPNLQANQGWAFFKLATPVTPNGTDVYSVGILSSVAGTMNFYTSATTNWTRMLRLTDTASAAPVANDKLMMMGEWTAGSPNDSLNNFTITMNETASTSYGPVVGPPQGMTINGGSTLTYGITPSTNYYLRMKGVLGVFASGSLIMGNTGSAMPSSSTAVLEFASVANVDSGLIVYNSGSFTTIGNSLAYDRAMLTNDVTISSALTYNGTTQYTQMGNNVAASAQHTISAWFKSTQVLAAANYGVIAGKGPLVATNKGYGLYLDGDNANKVSFQVRNAATVNVTTSTAALNNGLWHHVVGVIDTAGAKIYLYVDGVLQGTGTTLTASGYDDASLFGVGARYSLAGLAWGAYLAGTVDEVIVWSRALTSGEIGDLYNGGFGLYIRTLATTFVSSGTPVSTNLLAGWHFDENTGTSATDFSGNVKTGTIVLAPAWVAGLNSNLITDVSTGWLNGDTIAVASTTTTYNQCESKLLLANASGSAVQIAALTYAHSGTTPYQAEIINLTRNVKIRGITQLLCGYVYYLPASVVSTQWTEFLWLGSGTANKFGTTFATLNGSLLVNNCSLHDFFATSGQSNGFYTNTNNNNVTISNNVIYNMGYMFFYMNTNITNLITVTNNWGMLSPQYGYYMAPYIIFTGNRGIGTGSQAITIQSYVTVATSTDLLGTWDSNLAHSCSGYGFNCGQMPTKGGSITNITAWRCTYGLYISDGYQLLINGVTTYGNTTGGISVTGAVNCLLTNINSYNNLWGAYSGINPGTIIANSSFGVSTTNSNSDIVVANGPRRGLIVFDNCLFGSPTLIYTGGGTYLSGTNISFQKYQQIAGNHKTITGIGTLSTDSTIYYSLASGPSERMAPTISTISLDSSRRRTSCVNGQLITFSCYIRTSVLGDGTAWNGVTQPQLWLIANPALGVNSDTLLATASNLPGQWQLLSGTTPVALGDDGVWEVVVRCLGSTGWVNIANWTVA